MGGMSYINMPAPHPEDWSTNVAISDKSFAEHSKWLAFERNRFSWPKHWQVVIYKVSKQYDVMNQKDRYMVLPANPDYQKYLDECEEFDKEEQKNLRHPWGSNWPSELPKRAYPTPPPMHLGPVEFDSMEDINQWALVAHRLK